MNKKYLVLKILLSLMLYTNFSCSMENSLNKDMIINYNARKLTSIFNTILTAQEFIDCTLKKNLSARILYNLLKNISLENLEVISTIINLNIKTASNIYKYYKLKAILNSLNRNKSIISIYISKFYKIILIINKIIFYTNNLNISNKELKILLDCVSNKTKDAIKALLNCKFDDNNNNLLQFCIQYNPDIKINNLKNLIILGSNINAINKEGLSSLNLAIKYNNNIINTLIKNNANPNILDPKSDLTPLMWAVMYNNKILRLLLNLKSLEIDQQNSQGDTALIIASNMRNYKAIQLLLHNKADSTIKNNKGQSADELMI